MKFLLSMVTLGLLLSEFQLAAKAEVKIDEALKNNFSLLGTEAMLKPDAASFLMLQAPQQKAQPRDKAFTAKSQCFAANKQFVNCLH